MPEKKAVRSILKFCPASPVLDEKQQHRDEDKDHPEGSGWRKGGLGSHGHGFGGVFLEEEVPFEAAPLL